ncbi:MAG: CopG family ribbon-helix-helix protein [Thermodesulfobacteriota bacterium]
MGKMKATTVRIDDNVLDRVYGLATDLCRSRSWVINQAIKQILMVPGLPYIPPDVEKEGAIAITRLFPARFFVNKKLTGFLCMRKICT